MIPALPGCCRRLRRQLRPALARAGAVPDADRYRKHFTVRAHLLIVLLHGLGASASLRQTHARLGAVPGLLARLGLPGGISLSQLARSSTSRPGACFETLLAEVLILARRDVVPDRAWRLLRRTVAIDSTFIGLSAALSPWSRHGDHAPGVRVQTAFELARQLPTRLRLHLPATNDHEALKTWDLTPWRGWTVLIDLGYYGHQQFARLRQAGVSFLSRLHPQAAYQITAHRRVPVKATPEGDVVLGDETITLGSPNNRHGAVLPGIRLIRSRNAAGVDQAFITDRFDLTAFQLVRLYHYRWQIELFFRLLKRDLGVVTPLGRTPEAVWLTVLLAVVVALLLAVIASERPAGVSRIAWRQAVGLHLQLTLRGG
jgi:hypothetical protein